MLRGAAALLVLLAHLVGAERDYGGGGAILPGFLEMGVTGVDLFFLISGFVMVYVTQAPSPAGGPLRRSADFLLRRATRIYPLYWLVTLALLGLYAGKRLLFGEETELPSLVASFLLWPDRAYPVIPVGWTLIHEMYFYLVFSAVILFERRLLPLLLFGWFLVILAAGIWFDPSSSPLTSVTLSALTVEFLAGAALALIFIHGRISGARAAVLLALVWLGVLLGPLAGALYPDAVADHSVRTLIFTGPYALLLIGCVGLEKAGRLHLPEWSIRLGDMSYALYLVHIPVLLVVGRLFSPWAAPGIADNLVMVPVFIASCLLVAYGVHKWVEKPIIEMARRGLARWAPKAVSVPQTP